MQVFETLIAVATGAALVGGVLLARKLWRDAKAEMAFQELDAQVIKDIREHGKALIKVQTLQDEVAEARRRHAYRAAKAAELVNARNEMLKIEQRLKAAGYELVFEGVA